MGIFTDKNRVPDENLLKNILGNTFKLWEELKKGIIAEHGPVAEEWKFYGAKSGWTMKLLLKKRNLFFFIPEDGKFTLGFVFGDKAAAEVEESTLPETIKVELRNAKKYAEGRGVRIQIIKKADIKTALALVKLKIEN
jgi:hypothetical protein